MSLWTNWSQNWYKGYKEEELYNKQLNKAEADAGPDIEKFVKKYEELESLTPTEEPEFIAAAADMGLTDQEYISVWSQTKTPPVSYTNNRSQGVEDKTKQSYGLGPALMLKLTGNFFENVGTATKEGAKRAADKFGSYLFGTLRIFADGLIQSADKTVRNYSVEYQAALEEELNKKGKTLSDVVQIAGYENLKDNELPFIPGLVAHAKAFRNYSNQRTAKIINNDTYYTPSDTAKNFLVARGIVDEEGNPLITKTDLDIFNELFPDIIGEKITALKNEKGRDLSFAEKAGLFFQTVDNIIDPDTGAKGIADVISLSPEFDRQQELNETFFNQAIPVGLGDGIVFGLTGNLSTNYGYANYVTEFLDNEYDRIEQEAQIALDTGKISGTQYFDILENAEQAKFNAIQDIGYEKTRSMAGFFAGFINTAKYILLDPLNYIVPGAGLLRRTTVANFDEVLTSLGRSLPEKLDEGMTARQIFDENKETFEGIANLIVKAKDEDRPIGIYLINEGFHPDFVYRIKSVDTTADDIIETIEQGIENGFVTDMFYGGAFMGRGKNKHLQSKVIYESNLEALINKELDEGIEAAYKRGGGFRDTFLARDVKLPKLKPADLQNTKEAMEYFIRYGYASKIPESRLEELSAEFYDALSNGQYFQAKEIFQNKLVFGELGLQLKSTYGLTDNEIDDFMSKYYLKNDKQGFSDEAFKPMSPSRSPEFYDPMEVDIITNKMFGSVASEQDMIHLTKQSLELYGQLKNLDIHGPDIQGLLRATSAKRRIKRKLTNKEGDEEIFDIVRKAADEGVKVDFWKEGSALREVIDDVFTDFEEPNILFKAFEKGVQTYDNLVFGYMRNFRYPAFLLFRLSYPLKLIVDAMVKFNIMGVRNMLKNPIDTIKLMLNDPEGALTRVFGKPSTMISGPYRTTKAIEATRPSLKFLNDLIPKRVRKSLGVLSDSQEFGSPEIAQLFSADVKFVNNRFITNTGHDLINKQSPDHVKAYEYFLYKYIDDELAPAIAGMKRQGYTLEQIAQTLQKEPAFLKIIDEGNQGFQIRGPKQRNLEVGVVQTEEDFLRLAKHYSQSIDNYTGGSSDLLNVIADAKIGNINLRDLSSTTPDIAEKASRRIATLYNKNKDKLPFEIPYPKMDAERQIIEGKKTFRNLLNSLFFATTQGEGSFIRIPYLKQGYDEFVKAFSVFGRKAELDELLKIHNDEDSVINLSDDVIEVIQKERDRAASTLEEYDEVLNVNIKPQVTQKTYKGETTFTTTVFTEQGGNRSVNFLAKNPINKDSIKFTTDIQEAERLVYGSADNIAEGRLGFDDSKVGTFVTNFKKDEVIYNGALPNEDLLKDVLKNSFDSGYADSDIDIIVNEAIDYLSKPGATKRGLEDILGLSNKQPNLTEIKSKFQASTKGKSQTNNYSGELTFDVGRKTIEKVLGKKINVVIPKQSITDELIDEVFRFTQANIDGFSLNLGNPESWGKEAMLYVSPYKTRQLVLSGKDSLTKDAVSMFIKDNQDKLRLADHVLGGKWDESRGQWVLDVSVKINRGVKDTRINAGVQAYIKAKYLALAADQISFGESYLIKEGDEIVEALFKQDDTYEVINNSAVYNLLRTKGKRLLNDKQIKALGDEPIIRGKNYLASRQGKEIEEKAFIADTIFEKSLIKGIFDRKNKSLEVFNPRTNTIMQNMDEYSYTTLLDMNDVRANITRNMSAMDIHQRALEASMEANANLLYNLTERGYFAQAYRSSFAFFEAYREYMGRYLLLTANNPKAAVQIGQGVRRGIENNVIAQDRFGDLYVFMPTAGTPLQVHTKSELGGLATEDVSDEDSRVYIKKGYPLKSLGVGGVGYLPSLGDGITMPLGFLLRNNPGGRKFVEKNIMAGFQLPFSDEPLSLTELPAELVDMAIPSVAKNWFNSMGKSFGFEGVDEDIWISSTTNGMQIAAQLHPEYADDVDKIQEIGALVRNNLYTIKTWDRFVSPFAPKLSVLYKIEGNEQSFNEWYGEEGYEAGIAYNNMVELAAIHGFYQDMRKQWNSILGPRQGEYYALLEVVRLLGLDKYDISEQLTSAGLQVRGKTVSEAGRIPRTTKEYEFVNDNPELAEDYGPVLVYFSRNIDEGKIDFSGYQAVKYMGLITPKNEDEMYLEVQRYLASIMGRAAKDDKLQTLIATGKDTPENIQAANAVIDAKLGNWFPMAYGKSEQMNKVLGGELPERLKNGVLVDFLVRAVEDPRFAEFDITPFIKEYVDFRQVAIDTIQDEKNYPNEQNAVNWLVTSDTNEAQAVRMKLYDKGYEIIAKQPLFMVVFDEVFSYELNRFGVDN
jgi:hypothetical protein